MQPPPGKTAVILMNLGGPDRPEAVRPFLRNLFRDPAILRLPAPARWLLAEFISRRRAPIAREIYAHLGGKSPLLEETRKQAAALEAALSPHGDFRVFTAMRYWHPFADEVAREVKSHAPSRVILLPLYPQFSTTTTASSVKDWARAAAECGLDVPTCAPCCYPVQEDFIRAHTELLAAATREAAALGKFRILFSAHGLPKRVIEGGDPYQWQVEQTVQAVMEALAPHAESPIPFSTCYQSRVGRLEWIGPSTEHEIRRAAAEGMNIILVPIGFVSEHSETLVELDIEYAELAKNLGIKHFIRVKALGAQEHFIAGLAKLCLSAHDSARKTLCPAGLNQCLRHEKKSMGALQWI